MGERATHAAAGAAALARRTAGGVRLALTLIASLVLAYAALLFALSPFLVLPGGGALAALVAAGVQAAGGR